MTSAYVLYKRVSTREQKKSGLGLDAQQTRLNSFVDQHGGEVVAEFVEAQSGATDEDRPQLQAALEFVRAFMRQNKGRPIFLAISKLDRLSRDVEFIAGLMKGKVKFVVADLGHDVDNFQLHLFAALAEKERSMISARTKEALAQIRSGKRGTKSGKPIGNHTNAAQASKLGSVAVTKNADAFRAKIVPQINELKGQGLTLAKIASILNMRGQRTPRGGEWTAPQVCRML